MKLIKQFLALIFKRRRKTPSPVQRRMRAHRKAKEQARIQRLRSEDAKDEESEWRDAISRAHAKLHEVERSLLHTMTPTQQKDFYDQLDHYLMHVGGDIIRYTCRRYG